MINTVHSGIACGMLLKNLLCLLGAFCSESAHVNYREISIYIGWAVRALPKQLMTKRDLVSEHASTRQNHLLNTHLNSRKWYQLMF